MTSNTRETDQIRMSRLVTKWVRLAFLLLASSSVCHSQSTGQLYTFFKQNIGLNDSEIARIEQGKAVAKVLDSSTPSQVFAFGAVFIKAQPGAYVRLSGDPIPFVPILIPFFKILSTPKRAARVITKIMTDTSGQACVYYDEGGNPMQGSALVHDPKFQDSVVAETRTLLSTIPR